MDSINNIDYTIDRPINNPNKPIIDNIKYSYIKESKIHGYGLFSNQIIEKDILLGILDGQFMSYLEMNNYLGYMKTNKILEEDLEWVSIDKDKLLVRNIPTKYKYINHSNKPNIKLYFNPIRLITLRKIEKDEELLLDYNEQIFNTNYLLGHGKSYLFPNHTFKEFEELFKKDDFFMNKIDENYYINILNIKKDNEIKFIIYNYETEEVILGATYNNFINKLEFTFYTPTIPDFLYNKFSNIIRLYLQKNIEENINYNSDKLDFHYYIKKNMENIEILKMDENNKNFLLNYIFIPENIKQDNIINSFILYNFETFIDHLTFLPNKKLLLKFFGKREKDKLLFELKNINYNLKKLNKGFIIFSDFNNLKVINDEYSHQIADTMLNKFSTILKNKFFNNYHFRIGGDEFITILETKEELDKFIEYFQSETFNNELKNSIKEKEDIIIKNDIIFSLAIGFINYNINENFEINNILNKIEKYMFINKILLHIEKGFYNREKKKLIPGINKLELIELKKILKNLEENKQLSFLENIKNLYQENYFLKKETNIKKLYEKIKDIL